MKWALYVSHDPEYVLVGILELLLHQVPETMYFVKDTQLQYASVNKALLRRSGNRYKTEVVGHTAVELFPPPGQQLPYPGCGSDIDRNRDCG